MNLECRVEHKAQLLVLSIAPLDRWFIQPVRSKGEFILHWKFHVTIVWVVISDVCVELNYPLASCTSVKKLNKPHVCYVRIILVIRKED